MHPSSSALPRAWPPRAVDYMCVCGSRPVQPHLAGCSSFSLSQPALKIFLYTRYWGDTSGIKRGSWPLDTYIASGRPQRPCKGEEAWGPLGQGKGMGLRAVPAILLRKVPGRQVETLEAAKVDAHSLLLLPRLTVLGTHGYGGLGGEGMRP